MEEMTVLEEPYVGHQVLQAGIGVYIKLAQAKRSYYKKPLVLPPIIQKKLADALKPGVGAERLGYDYAAVLLLVVLHDGDDDAGKCQPGAI
jgi:hypothetical protein